MTHDTKRTMRVHIDEIDNPEAVETIFCKPFESLEKRSFDSDEKEIILALSIADRAGPQRKIEDLPSVDVPPLVIMIHQSIKGRFTFTLKHESIVIAIAMASKSIGVAIMYLAYIQYWARQNNRREIDWDDFFKMFPMEFPTDEALRDAWEKQKLTGYTASDNLLDYQSACKSIQFSKYE